MMYSMPPAEVGGIFFIRQLAYANRILEYIANKKITFKTGKRHLRTSCIDLVELFYYNKNVDGKLVI